MIDANMHYANAYLDELAKADLADEALARREKEIRTELTAQCKTLAGALKFVAELTDAESVLAGLIAGTNPIDKVIKAAAETLAREELSSRLRGYDRDVDYSARGNAI